MTQLLQSITTKLISGVGLIILALMVLNRFLLMPGTKIDGAWVGWHTPTQAEQKIINSRPPTLPIPIQLVGDKQTFYLTSDQFGAYPNTLAQISLAMQHQQPTGLAGLLKIWYHSITNTREYWSQIELDQAKTLTKLNQLAEEIIEPGQKPKFHLRYANQSQSLYLDAGKPGKQINVNLLMRQIQLVLQQIDVTQSQLYFDHPIVIAYSLDTKYPLLTPTQRDRIWIQAKQLVGKKINLTAPTHQINIKLDDKKLVDLIDVYNGIDQTALLELIDKLRAQIDRPPTSAKMKYQNDTLKVEEFQPELIGLQLQSDQLKYQLENWLLTQPHQITEIELNLTETPPSTSLAQTNSLGINQLIGFGESHYDHSIATRVHNVALAARIIQNIIVPPGSEFSFNQSLGEVSSKTGFQPAYIIREGKTELGDGGGVCQVSTTLFRAALNAGLKITRRIPHSYRVSYYELDNKPGIDATVYAGNVDLRFINDTPAHILIHSTVDSDNLYMNYQIYGTSDGRSSEIIDHQIWGWRPAPPPQYIPDPTLPAGIIKQIDWAATGINAKFTNVIKDQSGAIIRQDEYISHYQPWSAKFLVGTKE